MVRERKHNRGHLYLEDEVREVSLVSQSIKESPGGSGRTETAWPTATCRKIWTSEFTFTESETTVESGSRSQTPL